MIDFTRKKIVNLQKISPTYEKELKLEYKYKKKIVRIQRLLKQLLWHEKTSYGVYKIVGWIAIIPLVLLLIFQSILEIEDYTYFQTWIGVLPLILIPLIVIASILDLFKILKAIWGTKIGKFLYALFGFFAYAISDVQAKKIIYSIVGTNPDSFTSSLNIFTALLLISSWMLIIIVIVYFLILIQLLIIFILHVLNRTLSKKVDVLLNEKTIFVNKGHAIMSLTFGGLMVIMMAIIIWKYTEIKDQKILKSIIFWTAYYPNGNTCKNIDERLYIKFISAKDVSVTNYRPFDIFTEKKDITFKNKPCEYSID